MQLVGRKRREERAGQLVRILPNSAPLAERRTIVQDGSHLFKSFRLSILL